MIDLKKSAVVLALAMAMVACATAVTDESDAQVVDGYQYSINGDAATVTGYVGTETVISIPSQIEVNNKQCTVVGIGDKAFENQNIVDVTIPETVTSIGDEAFSNCKQLQYVCITGDVKIWSNAFLSCSNLIFIDLKGDSVEIQPNAFVLGSSKECTVRSPSAEIIEKMRSEGDSTQFKHLEANMSIVKYVTSGSPESVGMIGFDVVDEDFSYAIPKEAEATGYDILMYNGEEPIGESTEAPKGDMTITLVYSYHLYRVTFEVDGKIVSDVELEYESVITPPAETPTKNADQQFTYTFDKWVEVLDSGETKDFQSGTKVSGDHAFKAVFKETLNEYTVEFVSDGKVIFTEEMKYGETIVPPSDPTKKTEDGTDYRFKGWSGYTSGMTVTGDVVFEAVFIESDHEYTIQFLVDGKVFYESKQTYETPIVPPEENPTKETADGIQYTFAGWEGYEEGMIVTDDVTFTAVFNESPVDDGSGSTWIIVAVVVIIAILVALFLYKKFH